MITIGHRPPRQSFEEQVGVIGVVSFFYAIREFIAWQQGFESGILNGLLGVQDAIGQMLGQYDDGE